MTTRIPVGGDQYALVDDADAPAVLAAGPWCINRGGSALYAQRNWIRPDGKRSTQTMHKFLTGWKTTDHINGDGLDNQRSNLREATRSENGRNRGPQRNNTSGYKGVYRARAGRAIRNPWVAQLRHQGRAHYLGVFPTPEAAARAYDAAAIEIHSEFARLNFPQERAS